MYIDTQFFDFECFTSQSITVSMLVEFLHEIMKQHTSLSVMDFSPLQRINTYVIIKGSETQYYKNRKV